MSETPRPKILCVDDEAVVRAALERLLRDTFDVLQAGSAAEARVVLKENPDTAIILTDHGMPGETGLELLAYVKDNYHDTIRALLTGRVDIEAMAGAVNSALIQRFILKPWENAYLHLQMIEALHAHQTLKEKAVLEELSITDPVTHLKNHRYFQDRLRIEAERSDRHSRPLSLLMIDIDHFKNFNDQFGHPTGDLILRLIATRMTELVRTIDTVARYGGEEFAIILPETPFELAMKVAERVRLSFENDQLKDPQGRKTFVTISIGVASMPLHTSRVDELIKFADEALYRAKRQGRNQSVGASEIAR